MLLIRLYAINADKLLIRQYVINEIIILYINPTMSEAVNQNLFKVLFEGDCKIRTIKKKVILIIGLSRAGKSCAYNWILDKKMVGKDENSLNFYVNLINNGQCDQSAAELGSWFASVTLIPNRTDLDAQTTLIDIAGFGDTRNYVGVMGVSYFLKSICEQAEEIKFLVVIKEQAFSDTKGQDIRNTFLSLINILKTDALSSIKSEIFSSISLLVTNATQSSNQMNNLNNVLQRFKHPVLKIPSKELIIQFVQKIIQSQRIYAFLAAKPNQSPEACNMLDYFSKLNWQFLKIKEISQKLGRQIITIPFENDYKAMEEDDKIELVKVINQRIDSYSKFTIILKNLMNIFKSNWKKTVDNASNSKLPDNFMDQLLSFNQIFSQINTFVEKCDQYHSENLVKQEIRLEYHRIGFVQAIRGILQIKKIADLINQQEGTFQQKMKKYSKLFQNLADCIIPFCTNAQQQKMVLRLKFILNRGFHQFGKFYEINPEKIVKVDQELKDKCNRDIFNESRNEYIEIFMKSMRNDLLLRLFKTIPQINDYEVLFKEYKNNYEPSKIDKIKNQQFRELSIGISFAKGSLFTENQDKISMGIHYLSQLRLFYAPEVQIGKQDSASSQNKFKEVQMMKIMVFQKLINLLTSINFEKYKNAKDLALKLCKQSYEIDYVCEIYELQLRDYPKDKAKLCAIYQSYADFCIEWGRYDQANILLQKKLQLQSLNSANRIETINCIEKLVKNHFYLVGQYEKNLVKLKFISKDNSDIIYIFDEIQSEITGKFQNKQGQVCPEDEEVWAKYKNSRIQSIDNCDKLQAKKSELILPNFQQFVNSASELIKNIVQKEIIFFLLNKGQANDFQKQKVIMNFGNSYHILLNRALKLEKRVSEELLTFNEGYNEAIGKMKSVAEGKMKELLKLLQVLEDSLALFKKNNMM